MQFDAVRPTNYNLEMRLFKIHRWVKEFQPRAIIIDPMSNLILSGSVMQTKSFFMRLIDYIKSQQITIFLTNLTAGDTDLDQEKTEVGVSSLMDTWLELQTLKVNGERNRILYTLKSRGMMHSNQVREFIVTSEGVDLVEVYLGDGKVLTGTERINQVIAEQTASRKRKQSFEIKKRECDREKTLIQAQIEALQMQLANRDEEFTLLVEEEEEIQRSILKNQDFMRKLLHLES